MIVGNGEIPANAASVIDAADLVIRFNDCRSVGAGGMRTDIVAVCNTGRPALSMLGGGQWKTHAAVRQAREIWGVREGETFRSLRPLLAQSHPDLDDFCDDYTAGFCAFAAFTGRGFHVVPATTHHSVNAELAVLEAPPYVVPSSGLIVIAEILANRTGPGDRVVLAGFGHMGWPWHPFSTERRYVDRLVSQARVSRLDNRSPTVLAQGD